MKIGIDAGALVVSDDRLKVGVYRVTVNLLRELASSDTNNQYRLYSFDSIDSSLMNEFGKNMENRVLWPVRAWSSVRLPLELSLHPVDVFLGLSQMIPKSSRKSIGFVYDLAFLHRKESYPGSYKKIKKQTDELIKHSSAIITISETVKSDILNNYDIQDTSVTVAYPGVDERFRQKAKTSETSTPYFLSVGAMKPGKNVPSVIRAFTEFMKDSKVRYTLNLIGGDYWVDPEIDHVIEESPQKYNIRVLGHVSDDKLPDYYRGATALLSPSYYEGFCMPAAEAMSCGCPVIGSSGGAMSEIIKDGGIITDPLDVKAISRAMKEMAYNALRRDSYVKKSISISKNYNWKSFAEKVFSVMGSVSHTQ